MSKWFKRVLRFLKANLTTILLMILVPLVLADIIVRISYTQVTGEQFNNWVTPFISLFGFVAVIFSIFYTRREFRYKLSEPFVKFYIDEGAQTIMLGDTTGVANPLIVRERIGEAGLEREGRWKCSCLSIRIATDLGMESQTTVQDGQGPG